MRVIGIDLGTICCGYGIIEFRVQSSESREKIYNSELQTPNSKLVYVASGEVRMNKKDVLPERLKILYNSLKSILEEYKPSQLCVEKIFYHKSIRSAFALGSTRGIVMLLSAENGIPVFEYNSTELKMALTGYGRAEKRQVKEMVIRILNLQVSSHESQVVGDSYRTGNMQLVTCDKLTEDATDALALCICHIHHNTGYKSLNSL